MVKTLEEVKEILRNHRETFAEKYGIKRVRIFGSYAEGRQKETSDIDLIVEFERTPSLIEVIRIEEEIEKLLGVKVDLLTEEQISPFIKPYVKEVDVYEKD